jgi:hypothetical protein
MTTCPILFIEARTSFRLFNISVGTDLSLALTDGHYLGNPSSTQNYLVAADTVSAAGSALFTLRESLAVESVTAVSKTPLSLSPVVQIVISPADAIFFANGIGVSGMVRVPGLVTANQFDMAAE